MELTNNLKLLLVQTGPHTNAQAVVDNIENTESIDTAEAWASRYDSYVKEKNLGSWSGVESDIDRDYTPPTVEELTESLEANAYIAVAPIENEYVTPSVAAVWQLEKYESEAAYNADQYARDRQAVYPKLEDQLDKIFHDGVDAWKADIQAIKDAHPKT